MSFRALAGMMGAVACASCALAFPDYDLQEEKGSSSSTGGAGGVGGEGGATPLTPTGEPCNSNDECQTGQCLEINTAEGRICCAIACPPMDPESCGRNGKCDAGGESCALYPAEDPCGPTVCEDGSTKTDRCYAGTCQPGEAVSCAKGLACADDETCETSCATALDCANPGDEDPGPYCAEDECMQRPAGATCESHAQCESGMCGTTGAGHCCATLCNHIGEECGPADCNASGACIYPGAETACGPDSSCMSANLESQYCDNAGECGQKRTLPCPGHLGCASATSCHSTCGSNDATGDARCPTGYWCDGSTCHEASRDAGSTCLRDGQCGSNDCTAMGLCTPPGCDDDEDDQLATSAECGGLDCDDNDARVQEGQTAYSTTPRTTGSYDFDCDGQEEPELPTSCTCPGQVLLVPGGAEGCGQTGQLRQCNWSWFVCVPTNVLDDSVTQACR